LPGKPFVLKARLDRLVDAGILDKRPYQEHPPRSEYLLTERGWDLVPVLVELMQWGGQWGAHETGPPVELVHRTCGHVMIPHYRCDRCGDALKPRDVTCRPFANPSVPAVHAEPQIKKPRRAQPAGGGAQ